MTRENPRKWRYTWESQSHIPILKLYLFSELNPIDQCNNLTIDLIFEKSIIKLTWNNQIPPNLASLIVSLPRVLVDLYSPLNFRLFHDHIQVQIPLLLSVDHPIFSQFVSDMNSGDDLGHSDLIDEFITPLSMDSDFHDFSSKGGVEVCSRNCGYKLTKNSVRCLVDLPSVNWTDVADNWFGSCCCSFGSISEELVEDVTGFETRGQPHIGKCNEEPFDKNDCISTFDARIDMPCSTENSIIHDLSAKQGPILIQSEEHSIVDFAKSTLVDFAEETNTEHHCCLHDSPDTFSKDQKLNGTVDLQDEQKSFLNCYLGNAFLFRPSGLSKDIEWIDFTCPQCSHILGAYPCNDGSEPLDCGIRLLKCYISITSLSNVPDKLFRKYTLERMFTCQLLESAKDELSFRTVVKDLKTKCSRLNMILVNPNSWCCSGWCSEDTPEQFVKINLHPVVKVLFSPCFNNVKSEVSKNQEWEMKHQVDEVFMLNQLIRELMKSMERGKDSFPLSFSSTQGFLLSYIPR